MLSTATQRLGRPGGRRSPASEEMQRRRLIAALLDTVAEHGYARASVGRIATAARLSRNTFYGHYDDREACFLAAFEDSVERARTLALTAHEAEDDWLAGTRRALQRILELFDQDRRLARLLLVEAPAAGPRVRDRHSEVLTQLAGAIDGGRENAAADPPPIAGRSLLGGMMIMIAERSSDPGASLTAELLGPFMSMIALTYRGAEEARAQLSTPPAQRPKTPGSKSDADPLAGVRIRPTYRTIRVLAAIAANPAASNRDVADAAGITDAGQTSKLLARLALAGLIENHGDTPTRWAPKAWRLTELGGRVEQATRLPVTGSSPNAPR